MAGFFAYGLATPPTYVAWLRFTADALPYAELQTELTRRLAVYDGSVTVTRFRNTALFELRGSGRTPAAAVALANQAYDTIKAGRDGKEFRLIDGAEPPLQPSRPNRRAAFTLGILAFLGFGAPGLLLITRGRDKATPPTSGAAPNPWPHRLFWLVTSLVVLPLLAILAGLVGPRSPGAALLLMLAGGAALVLGYRVTQPKPIAATPPAAWNPWPRRVFLALLALVVLPLVLLYIGLLLPRLAMQANTAERALRAKRAIQAAQTDVGGLPATLPPGEPSPAAMKWHHAWKRQREAEARASVGVVSPGGPEVLAAQRDLAVAESEFKQQPEIAAQARVVYAQSMLDITQRRVAVGQATEAELDAARLAVTEARELLRGSPPGSAP